MLLSLLLVVALGVTWNVARRRRSGGTLAVHREGGTAGEPVSVPAAPPERKSRLPWPVRAAWWVLRVPVWWVVKRVCRRLWRHREWHAPWWACAAAYAAACAAYGLRAPWAGTALVMAAMVAAARLLADRTGVLPVPPDTVAGAAAVLGVWATAATAGGPTTITNAAWLAITAAVLAAWWIPRDLRAWRNLRLRVRNWVSALPAVLAELGAAGVVVASRPAVEPTGRVLFPLRLPVRVTRASLDKLRQQIEAGMHWPEGSIKEIRQDPDHSSAARVLVIWQDGQISARVVRFDASRLPSTHADPLWLGQDDQGRDVYVDLYTKTGMTRGLYGGEPGSAKSNLLRHIGRLLAYCPDYLLIVIDRKNSGRTFASLLPRIDWIATDRDEAIRVLQAMAAGIPLRGRLLKPEHNQVLPLSPQIPGVIVLYDEFSEELGKKRANQQAIEAAKIAFSQGRATGWGAEIASQYLSQGSIHPDLRPLFTRNACGGTRHKADAQFVLRDWTRVDTTLLPTGAFYIQLPGSAHPTLLYTPEIADADLAAAAAETAHLAPRLEESTAAELPHYADRWARLPDHLLPYCSDEQRRMVEEARARVEAAEQVNVRPLRTAAARRSRVMVSETIPDKVTSVDDLEDESLRTLCGLFVRSPAGEADGCAVVTTAQAIDAVAPRRSRQWVSERLAAWRDGGLLEQPSKGEWKSIVSPEALAAGVDRIERALKARRSSRGEEGL
ncbi:hypothetical protein [Nonomuraea sp. 10N515B]|uniref:hypothetical protein n=1 Tax=Nonomuraea sp. 10N515B TaxID=3457422 RepID=UPI003FCD6FD5